MAKKKADPAASQISAELVRMAKRSRFNPIASLTPQTLASHLDAFATGNLSSFALDAAAIKRRDDVISVALPKREKAVSRRGYAVHLNDGLDLADAAVKARAEEHQAALKYFFDNLSATNALDRNERGGMRLLVRQMMEAVGFRYAVHEIVWEPRTAEGKQRLTAHFTYVPLQFFENTTGTLRFLNNYFGGVDGAPMEDDAWLVTVGDGIMEALSVAWMFKQLSLKDWVSFNELLGTPIRLGKTNAAKDSEAWTVLGEALEGIGQDFAAIISEGSSIEFKEVGKTGGDTFAPLIERMDRAIATICRGADLSTMSAGAGQGQGASLQGGESDLLEQDDAAMISEALLHVSRIVIRELFGPEETPLAYLAIVVPDKKDAAATRENVKLLVDMGGKVSAKWAHDEFGVPAAAEDDELLQKAAAPASPFGAAIPAALANAAESALNDASHAAKSRRAILKAKAEAFAPLVARIEELIGIEDDTAREAAALKLKADLPKFAKAAGVTEPEITAWVNAMAAKLVSGAADAARARKIPAK